MYLLEGAGNFEWFWWKKGRVFQRGGNYVLLVRKKMHVFARGGGNFELFWWTKEHVFFQGGGKFVFFVNKNTHVFARGGGNFEVFCRKRNLLFRGAASVFSLLTRLCMYLPDGVGILSCSGGKRDMLFIGAASLLC